jgi:hypothetical protein
MMTALRRAMPVVAVATVLLAGAGAAGASTGAHAKVRVLTRWGRAEQVPALAALNKGHVASVSYFGFGPVAVYQADPASGISCWTPGDCAAGGSYTDGEHHTQAWVALERKGRWGKAIEFPGTAALNEGGNAVVTQMSCARTGVCAAVGTYTDQTGAGQWFTATERNGRWSAAVEVPYPALNQAIISTVWCEPGLCAAGGSFTDSTGTSDAWVRTEVNGRWQPGLEVPGLAALNTEGNGPVIGSGVSSITCASAGSCAAGGYYVFGNTTAIPSNYAFVVTKTSGIWGAAEQVPNIQSLDVGQNSDVTLITCPSAGNCTAAGYDQPGPEICETFARPGAVDKDVPGQPPPPEYSCVAAFVVNEHHGTWEQATGSPLAYVFSLTCPAAGDCLTGGVEDYDEDYDTHSALVSETGDHWGPATVLGNTSAAYAVSCGSPGYCSAGGKNLGDSAFVITEWNGKWGKPTVPAGLPSSYTAAQQTGAAVSAVSCPPGKTVLCVAGGDETGPKGAVQAFVVSQVQYRVR